MSGNPILTLHNTEPHTKPLAYECKFTVEGRGGVGGDWERNAGGMTGEKRVTFEGYASPELCYALIEAIGKVIE